MLFNSYIFLLGFVPIVYIGYFLIGKRHWKLAAGWVALASIVFYGWWNPVHVPVLLASVVLNYFFGIAIARTGEQYATRRKIVLVIALTANLAALFYYKYSNFLVDNISALTGVYFAMAALVLPLGISFFTFTQVAYLVDTYKAKVTERNFVHYLLFVTYFPHLIAGPVIHHKDVMPQFARRDTYIFSPSNFTIGVLVFMIGLFKKCFIADSVAAFASPVFRSAENGGLPDLFEAWGGALAYTFQLYFDFSGYSDMAVGLSLMLNIRLPLNFNSPYKARNIIDFWKRWHISLSTFLRDYLYIPLGGNRRGRVRRYINLFATMLIGGLWHGASWTFVAWGALHGIYLMINHAWQTLRQRIPFPKGRVESTLAWLVTFLAVVVAWVFFRAATFESAARILAGMLGWHGARLPAEVLAYLPALGQLGVGVVQGGLGSFVFTWGWCLALLPAASMLPNTQEFVSRSLAGKDYFAVRPHSNAEQAWLFPSPIWAVGMGVVTALALMNLGQPAEFLYFNF